MNRKQGILCVESMSKELNGLLGGLQECLPSNSNDAFTSILDIKHIVGSLSDHEFSKFRIHLTVESLTNN